METKVCSQANTALKEAAGALSQILAHYLNKPVLFLSSGGSSLGILDNVALEMIGPNVTISVSDDRYSYDPAINNFSQLRALPFYSKANERGAHFIDIRPNEGETLEEVGKRFDQQLKQWRKDNPEGKIIMTQGIGPDRHTCGMMPFPENPKKFDQLFNDINVWAVGYDGRGKNEFPERITVTLPFLRNEVQATIVYACSANKRAALEALMSREGDLPTTPSRILREMKQATLFTDIKL